VSTADRVLSVLALFTMEQPEWTVEEAMVELGLSSSTAYQYFRSLVEAGLLVASRTGLYSIGPGVIRLDRITRRHDPLIREARDSMHRLADVFRSDGIALLCRSFRSQVMCVDQLSAGANFAIGYERGRPMPLFRGAASKAILAQMPSRATRRLWDSESDSIAAAGLGKDWEAFKASLRQLRRHPAITTFGEIDPGLVGISAAVFDAEGLVCGSLGVVLSAAEHNRDQELTLNYRTLVAQEAEALTARLNAAR